MAPEISMVLRRRRGKRLVRALLSASIKWSRGLICCFILTLMAWMPSGFCVHGPPEFVIARRRIVPNELRWFVCGSCCMHCLNIFLSWFAPRSGRAIFFGSSKVLTLTQMKTSVCHDTYLTATFSRAMVKERRNHNNLIITT